MENGYDTPYDFTEPEMGAEEQDGKKGNKIKGFFADFLGFGKNREEYEEYEEEEEEEELLPEPPPPPPVKKAPPPVQSFHNPASQGEMNVYSNTTKSDPKNFEPKGVVDMTGISSSVPNIVLRSLTEAKVDMLEEVVSKMRENTVVMLNLEQCNGGDYDKITTFLSGAACFQQGVIKQSGARGYILLPPNAKIDSNIEDNYSF